MFNLHAGNGQIVLTSERYAGRDGALNGIASIKQNAASDARYAFSDDGLRFSVKAANGQVIGTSQAYATAAAAQEGTQAVKRAAAEALVDDQT